jgi:RNA polymerase-interacting CarD/CdnL/TRCF family regulator
VPIADEKTEGPTCVMKYLGLTIDTREMTVKIPDKKMKELQVLQLRNVFSASYINLHIIRTALNT